MARFTLFSALLAATQGLVALAANEPCGPCITQSQPNPLRSQYPADITGTLNGTLIAWLVDISYAQSLVPEYPLLLSAAKAKYPALPEGKYPLFADPVMNFDGGFGPISIEPFHRVRANVPFVDRLKDGYTSFRYNLPMAISRSIIEASAAAGAPLSNASASTFSSSCNGYGAVPGSGGKEIYKKAYLESETTPVSKPAVFTSLFKEGREPFGLNFFKNITNQPAFGAGLIPGYCAQGISFFNTSLTEGQYAPVAIRGQATFKPPLLPAETTVEAFGYKLDVSFLERQFPHCMALQGYAGTGSGDSG